MRPVRPGPRIRMNPTRYVYLWALRCAEALAAWLSLLLAAGLTALLHPDVALGDFALLQPSWSTALFTLLLLALWSNLYAFFGLYQYEALFAAEARWRDVVKAVTTAVMALLLTASVFHLGRIDAGFLAVFWLSAIASSLLCRRLARHLLVSRSGLRAKERVLVVGTNTRAMEYARNILAKPEFYVLAGFADDRLHGDCADLPGGCSLVADFATLPEYLRRNVVDEVAICLPIKSLYDIASNIVAACEEQGISVVIYTQLFEIKNPHLARKRFNTDLIMRVFSSRVDENALLVKRIIDVAGASLLLVLTAPILLAAALAVKLDSPGPAFFVQKRVGYNKRLFDCYKLRTMRLDAEAMQARLEDRNISGGSTFKIPDDPRVTRIGRFLRKSSIDELPQLLNVLKGDMSLVGPRPLPVRDWERFEKDWPRRRFSVRPGITCLWQISGRNRIGFERWMELDMEYIDNWSLGRDLAILLRTVPAVCKREGAC